LLCGALLGLAALAPGRAAAGQKSETKTSAEFHFEFKDRPSLRVGKLFRIDLRTKVQTDFRTFSPDVVTDEGTFDLHRARLSVEGEAFKVFEYEVERDFRQSIGANDQRYPWKDVNLNFKYFDNFQLKLGKFKVPFSLDELTGEQENDFAVRSRIADDLAPGRDVGGMLHGRFFKRGLSYQAGVFRRDGENPRARNGEPFSTTAFAVRLTGTPLRAVPAINPLHALEIGAAYTRARVPEGLSGVRGHTVSGDVYFPYVYVQGPRQRIGGEASWTAGRFSLKAEFINMTEAREKEGVFVDDLPAKVSRGWYATGTWVLTGEKKEGGVEPKRPFLDGGFGALELAGRYEQIRFGTTDQTAAGFTSPRSRVLRSQSDRVWTGGVNWYPHRYFKLQMDAIHERIEENSRSPLPGRNSFWMGILRLQFAM
jgi:phosphate-selective porin